MEAESTDIKDFEMVASDLKNVKMQDATPEYIGKNTFTNNTNTEQVYSTVSYKHSSTKSTFTSTTKGFSVAGQVTVFKKIFKLPNGVGIFPFVNPSTTETQKDNETIELTVPPQTVRVPAHKKYKVEVVYLRESLSGQIDFYGEGKDLTSNLTAHMTWQGAGGRQSKKQTFSYKTNSIWNNLSSTQKNSIEGITFDGFNNFKIEGTAALTGIVGTTFQVNTYDITNSKNPVLIQVETIN